MTLSYFQTSLRILKYSHVLCHPCRISFHKNILQCPNQHMHQLFNRSLSEDRAHYEEPNSVTNVIVNSQENLNKCDTFGNLEFSWETRSNFKNKLKLNKEVKVKPRKLNKNRHAADADAFGNLTDEKGMWYSPLEEDTEFGSDHKLDFPIEKQYKTTFAYLRKMKSLVKQKKLKEALELIPDMKKNHIFPSHANYTFMIGACGRSGYTDMAFKLLKQLTDRGYRPSPATLTGLFNSCAECPFPELGLKKAKHLKEKIAEKNWLLTQPTYHAMIKSFGKCGDLATAFEIVDDMAKAEIQITAQTYSFLFMSCISDEKAGFTHAIEVWRKMLSKKIGPHLPSFNLLLRAVRDCGIGPEEYSALLLQHWSSYRKRPYGLNDPQKSITSHVLKLPYQEKLAIASSEMTPLIKKETNLSTENICDIGETGTTGNSVLSDDIYVKESEGDACKSVLNVIPNILSVRPLDGPTFVDILSINTPADRLALIGNAEGFLNLMKSFKIQPDIKTFTLMLESLADNVQSEDHLISLMDASNVVPDVDFFNVLIKKRNMRKDSVSAQNVLDLIHKYNLSPDVVTFGVLALGCHTPKQGFAFLRDMKNLGYYPNVEIMGGLIHHACSVSNFSYLQILLNVMKSEDVLPNERILKKIEDTITKSRLKIIAKEQKNEWTSNFPFETFLHNFQEFGKFYPKWLQDVQVQLEEHPWKQYETDIIYRGK